MGIHVGVYTTEPSPRTPLLGPFEVRLESVWSPFHAFRASPALFANYNSLPDMTSHEDGDSGKTPARKGRGKKKESSRKEPGEVQTPPRGLQGEFKRRVVTDDRSMDNSDRLLSVDELADYLGVPAKTLYAWRHRREGPLGFRVGRHLRYRWSDVQAWIEEQLDAANLR